MSTLDGVTESNITENFVAYQVQQQAKSYLPSLNTEMDDTHLHPDTIDLTAELAKVNHNVIEIDSLKLDTNPIMKSDAINQSLFFTHDPAKEVSTLDIQHTLVCSNSEPTQYSLYLIASQDECLPQQIKIESVSTPDVSVQILQNDITVPTPPSVQPLHSNPASRPTHSSSFHNGLSWARQRSYKLAQTNMSDSTKLLELKNNLLHDRPLNQNSAATLHDHDCDTNSKSSALIASHPSFEPKPIFHSHLIEQEIHSTHEGFQDIPLQKVVDIDGVAHTLMTSRSRLTSPLPETAEDESPSFISMRHSVPTRLHANPKELPMIFSSKIATGPTYTSRSFSEPKMAEYLIKRVDDVSFKESVPVISVTTEIDAIQNDNSIRTSVFYDPIQLDSNVDKADDLHTNFSVQVMIPAQTTQDNDYQVIHSTDTTRDVSSMKATPLESTSALGAVKKRVQSKLPVASTNVKQLDQCDGSRNVYGYVQDRSDMCQATKMTQKIPSRIPVWSCRRVSHLSNVDLQKTQRAENDPTRYLNSSTKVDMIHNAIDLKVKPQEINGSQDDKHGNTLINDILDNTAQFKSNSFAQLYQKPSLSIQQSNQILIESRSSQNNTDSLPTLDINPTLERPGAREGVSRKSVQKLSQHLKKLSKQKSKVKTNPSHHFNDGVILPYGNYMLLTRHGLYIRDPNLKGNQSKIPLQPNENSTTLMQWYQDMYQSKIGPCLPPLEKRPISDRLRQRFYNNHSDQHKPDNLLSRYIQPLPISRSSFLIKKPLAKSIGSFRFRHYTARCDCRQCIDLGSTSVNPCTFLKHVSELQSGCIDQSSNAEALSPSFNISHPCHKMYGVSGNVHWREQALRDLKRQQIASPECNNFVKSDDVYQKSDFIQGNCSHQDGENFSFWLPDTSESIKQDKAHCLNRCTRLESAQEVHADPNAQILLVHLDQLASKHPLPWHIQQDHQQQFCSHYKQLPSSKQHNRHVVPRIPLLMHYKNTTSLLDSSPIDQNRYKTNHRSPIVVPKMLGNRFMVGKDLNRV
ncbi:hypothetical protein BATDEDRAFT_89400 [Batrachochytrium dendrobatidis JAM81]|uniref:Uncharacterized protein n=1 Tax=Batrachochytrium dendrobatidis (strain JAM81 / FGSC 10211) TaxID=684364 RepID=F4P4B8_BATDJ|nr:uncharacterized protein BATDEDRAFT_89400 [Batrachochytrium dendrobatidis JAM81]EGF79683.1 hypothetical protein BATDEDRAFT_89400 [Batrachochytrium dendrobatidis JAM81]|eukprot:XP_006679640.1 hypothetical protein BATDEDRAFT_89400 [Batrachochytrium dendrobatidis JAM81]